MGLLDGLEPQKTVRPCRVRSILAQLDDKDVDILDSALKSPELWPAKTLSNALKQRGLVVSDGAISGHRKGSCSCGKID
jgi:hypothetical protein